jgi:large subunit ribosomal protein L18
MSKQKIRNMRRKGSVRARVKRAAGTRTRLSIHRTGLHIYAQLINDEKGETVASASTMEKSVREGKKSGANIEAAKNVGKLIAERAIAKGVKDVAFDRGGYRYHGRVKALADAAREGGLNF